MKKVIYFFGRFLAIIFAYSMYRLTVEGRKNIPNKEAVVYVCNHVTYMDWLILSAVIPKKVRFVMTHIFWNIPLLGWFFRIFDAIPIAPYKSDPVLMEEASLKIKETLNRGESVFIFPEGMLTRDGNICVFKKGINRIISETPVRVIPISLQGMWGSYFSFENGKPFIKPFKRGLFNKIKVVIGQAINPEDISSESLQNIVEEMTNGNT